MSGRRHEHEFEPVPGLPERLPAGEHILWQGAPSAGRVARHVCHLPLAAGYFALLAAWQAASARHDGAAWSAVAAGAAPGAAGAATALALLALLAWLVARTTLYTLTDRRVVMRIGIVLTVSYNLPLRCIDAAHVHAQRGGHGDIALTLRPGTRIAWLHLWPHARPWCLRQPQPMLRCLTNAAQVAAMLTQAWTAANAVRPTVPTGAAVATVGTTGPAPVATADATASAATTWQPARCGRGSAGPRALATPPGSRAARHAPVAGR